MTRACGTVRIGIGTGFNGPGASERHVCVTCFEFVLRFAVWAQSSRVTPKAIQAEFGVSRATAYRWRRAWEAAVAYQAANGLKSQSSGPRRGARNQGASFNAQASAPR